MKNDRKTQVKVPGQTPLLILALVCVALWMALIGLANWWLTRSIGTAILFGLSAFAGMLSLSLKTLAYKKTVACTGAIFLILSALYWIVQNTVFPFLA